MTVHALADWLREHSGALTASLLDGTYQPQPVRGAQFRKPEGGQRQLGIPVVVDRLVQQAILQVLNPIFDPTFSNSSYGFRAGRDAHMALEQARKYVAQEGREFVVDLDLEKFFDRVNHDTLAYVNVSLCLESRAGSAINAYSASFDAFYRRT